jgi:glucose-6-phosphate isomerase
MDEHFRTAPLAENIPVLLGLIGLWNNNFLGAASVAVLPYAQALARFPAYLQQLIMESNGKRVTRGGQPVPHATAPVYWGEPGTNGQHSFHQLLHQGTRFIPCDFIVFEQPLSPYAHQHDMLVANALAQAEALAFGKSEAQLVAEGCPVQLAPHRASPGNRPSNMLLLERLTPAALGRLVALYEHATFVQAAIWNINPFDQWGVELGKTLAQRILPEFTADAPQAATHDSSTSALVRRYRQHRQP